jgi:DNA-binding beta-propeller fold protein YncE
LLSGGASVAYDIANAVYDDVSFSIASEETGPQSVFFKPDGTKMLTLGKTGDAVYEYNLSSAWDISSSSYLQNFSVVSEQTDPTGLFFKPDGTKMYIIGNNGDKVNEYNLSSAWDISSSSYLQDFSVASQETAPNALFFKPDGTKMYVVGSSVDKVIEYDLSSAWDISSASYLQDFSVASQEVFPTGLFFKSDGTKMYVTGSIGDAVYEYDLSIAWDVSSASYLQNFSFAAQDTSPQGIFFKSDGTKMYACGNANDTIYQYNTSTPATITYDPDLQWSGGTAPTAPPIGETDVITFNTTDGGTTYKSALAIDGAK